MPTSSRGVRYPVVSTEGILWLNPDVIVDLVPTGVVQQIGRQTLLDDWNEVGGWRPSRTTAC